MMADKSSGRERREAQRFACAGDAEIVVPGSGLRFAGRIANLSATGCFIETTCCLERGTSVELWLKTEGLPLRVAANLLVRRPSGVGLRFHSLTGRRLDQIRQLIQELAEAEQDPWPENAHPGPRETMPAAEQADRAPAGDTKSPQPRESGRGPHLLRALYSLCVRSKEFLLGRKALS